MSKTTYPTPAGITSSGITFSTSGSSFTMGTRSARLDTNTLVEYRGRTARLSSRLIVQKELTDKEVQGIVDLHQWRMRVEAGMELEATYGELHTSFDLWTAIQYLLQTSWKFPKDEAYHRFWTVPQCICPKMDNEDRYPSLNYIRDPTCLVHGAIRK